MAVTTDMNKATESRGKNSSHGKSFAEAQGFKEQVKGSSRTPTSQATKHEVPCPVCDSAKYDVLYQPWVDVSDPVKLYGAASGIQGTQTIVKCSDCGMIYENPRYPEEVILEGYKGSMEEGHDSQYPMRVNSFYRTLVRHKDVLPQPGARVLDIGTAGGAFLDAAARFGYQAEGLEPSRYLVDAGNKRGLKIHHGTIQENPLASETYDMVCLWDVIEHVVHPKADLLAIRKLLKPGGILLINYPDIGTLGAKLTGKKFWWILSVHLHHFDRQSIRNIAERTGYEVFRFAKYWQTLEFGYLGDMAVHLKVPTASFFNKLVPGTLRRLPLPYYAAQTTALLKLKQESQ